MWSRRQGANPCQWSPDLFCCRTCGHEAVRCALCLGRPLDVCVLIDANRFSPHLAVTPRWRGRQLRGSPAKSCLHRIGSCHPENRWRPDGLDKPKCVPDSPPRPLDGWPASSTTLSCQPYKTPRRSEARRHAMHLCEDVAAQERSQDGGQGHLGLHGCGPFRPGTI